MPLGGIRTNKTNRAFDVTFASLRDAGLQGKVEVHIDISYATMHEDASLYTDCFDPTTLDWKVTFSESVSHLALNPNATSSWALDLFIVLPSLQQLELIGSNETFHFRHPTSGIFVWPLLRHIQLQDLYCHAETLLIFLDGHKAALEYLYIVAMICRRGTWKDVFPVLKEMPKLDYLQLGCLSEPNPPSHSGSSFDRFYDEEDWRMGNLEMEGHPEIHVGIDALLYDFRTFNFGNRPVDPGNAEYRVDIRLAQAIVLGEAEMRNGKCELWDMVSDEASMEHCGMHVIACT
jgi:hypothetical protein